MKKGKILNKPKAIKEIVITSLLFLLLIGLNQFGAENAIIADLRISRFILLLAVGAGLSVAGVALQSLFFNPLCDPYILGVSSAGALGAVLGSGLGWSILGLHFSAFLGCLIGVGVLWITFQFGRLGTLSLLLVGVMQGFVFSSLLALWMSLADPMGVYGAMSWLLGDVQIVSTGESFTILLIVVFLIWMIFIYRNELDLMLLGEEHARSMGCPVDQIRFRLVLVSSLIVAICVSSAGMIGFVGLVIPHLMRIQVSSLHSKLIPMSAVAGGLALNTADSIGHALFPVSEIPLGALCALIGAPVLVFILIRVQSWRWVSNG